MILGERGYESRKLLSVEDEFGVLQAKLPGDCRVSLARVTRPRGFMKTDGRSQGCGLQAQRRLLREGSAAELT